ncbi:MAG: anti-sigma regulatory factor [Desulfovibrionaceae bacterium]|nr:anti-sigma regulatory factor [Desulfovibrionaceae bacterium]MBF0512819.1 anti-sigma regulatory factor [Desulfovibrionaceae bacterium]
MAERILDSTRVEIGDVSDKTVAVGAARQLCKQAGFDETRQFMLATAVSELATNIARYAGKGEISLRIVESAGRTALEVEAKDNGPGIADLELAMSDNYSTIDSLGLGLPSVKRIMDEFHIDSAPGRGARILCRKWR